MGRLKVKGKAGAARNYITRSSAIKKLQCSLADFRRLCILKGIFPREPRSRKKANKGSSAPASFYYAKDIAYIAHEPILKKLREHKAFAKKLARALGRGEWSSAKSLEQNKPIYRLDHVIKERYPTFIDAVRDIDDALCMTFLFATLPCDGRLPKEIIENCSRLAAEWQLYVMHSRALRKVFLSIKGVYFQAEVMDQTVNWLTPYQFTQNIPPDVDVRVMLTFLELYQTLLSFVFFKLYSDAGLVYPPPLDAKKDEGGAGIDAIHIKTSSQSLPVFSGQVCTAEGRSVSAKDVRQTIKTIDVNPDEAPAIDAVSSAPIATQLDEEFVPQTSTASKEGVSTLPTLQTLSGLPQTMVSNLLSPFTFWLSREVSRSIFEFVVRSFGGQIGWPPSSGGGSPFDEAHPNITHVITDRPVLEKKDDPIQRELRARRKYIQPQWIVDCVNVGKVLLEEPYGQGKILPPHLSPFDEYEGAYIPLEATDGQQGEEAMSTSGDEDGDEIDNAVANAVASGDPTALVAAELEAEAAGVGCVEFEAEVHQAIRKQLSKSDEQLKGVEHHMNKMMMSNKQKKLYEKMKYSQAKKTAERLKLEERRKELSKQRKAFGD